MRDRTADLLRAKQALSQLSYSPIVVISFTLILAETVRVISKRGIRKNLVGLSGLEPPTSPLSGVRSNHLSYKPAEIFLLLIFIRQSV